MESLLKFKCTVLSITVIVIVAAAQEDAQAQSNSSTNNNSTNNVTPIPTGHPTELGSFNAAYSASNCLEIWRIERAKKIDYFNNLLR